MTLPFKTLSDVELRGKIALVRVDFNSPIVDGKIADDSRIQMHSKTLQFMAEKGARVVVIAHQGRPGSSDFTSLDMHAEKLKQYVNFPVRFVDDITGDKALNSIKNLNDGEILLLDNIRKHPDELKKATPEELSKTELVKTLSSIADIYVNDAFAAAHRAQTSLVAFPLIMDSYAGIVMEREVKMLSKVKEGEKPLSLVLGGTKIDDSLDVAAHFIKADKADYILPGGLLVTIALAAEGIDIGVNMKILEKFKVVDLIDKMKELKEQTTAWIDIIDVALDVGSLRKEVKKDDPEIAKYPIKDIGTETAEVFLETIAKSKTVFLNGPMGVYEETEFRKGTEVVFNGIAHSQAFSIAGGGHTLAALSILDLMNEMDFVSSGGGSLIEFLKGKTLPAIKALQDAPNNK